MMVRVRLLLVAPPGASVRGLGPRLQDPDLQLIICGSAREALERLGSSLPDLVVLDGSLPRPDVVRLYGRLRASIAGADVPIVFTSHDEASAALARTTAPDFYVGPEATLDEIEQVLFTFLPESLFEVEPRPAARPAPASVPAGQPAPAERPVRRPGPRSKGQPASSGPPSWAEIGAQLKTGPAKAALAYLGVYTLAEVLAAVLDTRLGLLVHAGLLLAVVFHGTNVPAGPERTFFWTLWLAPLTRIYALAQPYAGAQPLTWWALTAIPMAVAGVVAMRLAGLRAREAGLVPSMREAPIAALMVPFGLALGILEYLLLEPRALGQELAFGGVALVVVVAIVNPGIVDEIVFRGVLQRGTAGLFGPGLGVIYVSLLYALVIPAGLTDSGSLIAIPLTLVVGLLLSAITVRTGSVLSAAVAHATLAVGLFVIGPYLMPNGLGLRPEPPVRPAPVDIPLPTPKPAVIVVSPPAQPSPSAPAGQPAPPGQTLQPGQAAPPTLSVPGQPPAGQAPPAAPAPAGPTHISLAPPLSPPQAGVPGAGPQPGVPGASGVQGQAAVVRGTGGSGARLRAQPGNSGQIITVVPENTPLLVIGTDRTVDGLVWRNVRAPSGSEGWIAASFVTTGQ